MKIDWKYHLTAIFLGIFLAILGVLLISFLFFMIYFHPSVLLVLMILGGTISASYGIIAQNEYKKSANKREKERAEEFEKQMAILNQRCSVSSKGLDQ